MWEVIGMGDGDICMSYQQVAMEGYWCAGHTALVSQVGAVRRSNVQ